VPPNFMTIRAMISFRKQSRNRIALRLDRRGIRRAPAEGLILRQLGTAVDRTAGTHSRAKAQGQ
jgi:hypothetical protein